MAKFVLTAELSLQAPKNVAQVVQQIQSQLSGVKVDVQVRAASQAKRDIDALASSADRANDSFFKMGRTFTASIRRFSALAIATRAVSLMTNTLGGAIEEAIRFQQEVVRISQVTGTSINDLSKLTNEITNLATSLGVSSDKLLSVSTVLAQAGLSAEDTRIALSALAKTELAPTFGDISETAEGAVAILAQFKLGAGALEAQLGSLNAVAGKFAVESGDLVEAIRRTGGVFKASGGDLNELISLFTSVRATTRESAATIATGLRTIFTRIQRPQTIEYLKRFGIELTDLEGKFIGPFDAIGKLSEALSGLEEGDITFIEIAEELGGFRQIGKVIPLLREFAISQAALKVAQEGSGSLAKDQATAQLALAVQITKVKEEFFALVRGFTETSTFRVMADVVLKLASTFISLAESVKPILPILTAFAGIRLAQGIGGLIGGVLGRARGMSQGGKVLGFAKGGLVPGSGSGTADDVPAMLSSGEFVMKESAVKRIGANNLDKMNKGGAAKRFAVGGIAKNDTVGMAIPDTITKEPYSPIFGKASVSLSDVLKTKTGFGVLASKSINSLFRSSSNKKFIPGKVPPEDLDAIAKTELGFSQKTYNTLSEGVTKNDSDQFSKIVNQRVKESIKLGASDWASSVGVQLSPDSLTFADTFQLPGGFKGSYFESVLDAFQGKPIGAESAESNRPFDFTGGLKPMGTLFDQLASKNVKYIDAKISGGTNINEAQYSKKITNQLALDLIEDPSFTQKINTLSQQRISENQKRFGGIIQKFAIGGRAKGIQNAPLVDDILQASGSILPRPSAAMQALIDAGGGAVDVDRTLKRTIGDTAYAKAPTPEAKNAALNTYFRDEAKRLQDLKTAQITQFGAELRAGIKSGQLDPRKVSIISKSKRVKGAAEYLSSQFGIPVQNMIFTQGGSKQPAMDAIRTKGPRIERVGKFFGGMIQRFANGGVVPGVGNRDTVPAMLNEGDFVIRKSSTQNIGTDTLSSMAGYASGGSVSKGVPALLTPGEFVFSREQAQSVGYGQLNKMNKVGKYAKGGTVGAFKSFTNPSFFRFGGKAAKENISDSFNREGYALVSSMTEVGSILQKFIGGLTTLPDSVKSVVGEIKTFKLSKDQTYKTNAGDKSGDQLRGISMGGKIGINTNKAGTHTVKHEAAHEVDRAIGGGKQFASQKEGTFQNKVALELQKTMQAEVGGSEYRLSLSELFADALAKVPPEVQKILVSTTDAAKGSALLAEYFEKAGGPVSGLADLSADEFGGKQNKAAPTSSPSIPTATPPSPLGPTVKPPAPRSPTPPKDKDDTTNAYINNMSKLIKERTQVLAASKVEESRLNSEVTKQANVIKDLRAQSSAGIKVSSELNQAHARHEELLKQQEATIQQSLTAEAKLAQAQKRKAELILQAKSEKQAATESRKTTLKGGTPSTYNESTVGKMQASQDKERQDQEKKTKEAKEAKKDGPDPSRERSLQFATALASAGTALGYFQTEITENSSGLAIFTNNLLSSIQSMTLVIAALEAFGLSLSVASIKAGLDTLSTKFPALGSKMAEYGISTANFASGLQAGAIATAAVVIAFNVLMSTLQESARLEKERQMKLATLAKPGSDEQKTAIDKSGKAAASEAGMGVRNAFGTAGAVIGGIIGTIAGGAAGATAGSVVPLAGTAAGAAIGGAAGGTAGAAAGTGIGVGIADLFGYTEEAAVLAESQNRIATIKLASDKAMADASKDASKALKDFQDGTATAADVLKATASSGQLLSMQREEVSKANEAEKTKADKSGNMGAWLTGGYIDSKEERQTKADENSKIRNEELKKSVDNYIEMNQAGTSALSRANAASGQSFDEFFNNLKATNAPLAEAYSSSEENLKQLEKEFANIAKETERTKKAFEAMNLGFQGVNSTASAMTVGLENYLASQQAGNIGLAQSINTLQAGLTNAAQGISTEAFQGALLDAENALVSMGATEDGVTKFKENMTAINTAQKFYASATEEAKKNLMAEFQRGAAGSSDPAKRQEALSSAITSQLEGAGIGQEVRDRIGQALAGAKIEDGDLEAILSGNFEVLDKVLKDLGDKTFGQVSKALEQYVKYQQQLVKLTQDRIKIEGQLRDTQKSVVDSQLEAAKISQEFGGAAVTPDRSRQAIISKANIDSGGLGVGNLRTGSASEIKNRQANTRKQLEEIQGVRAGAAAGNKEDLAKLQGEEGARLANDEERLKKLAQDDYNTTKALIDQKREEIKLIQSKNQLEKASMDALISGDIMKFFESQSAMGAQAALATGDQQLISQFDTASLGEATKDLERQREAGVGQKFGMDIGGAGGLVERGYGAIGGRVGLDDGTVRAAAQTTPEQLQAEKEGRDLAATLPANMETLAVASQNELKAADGQLEAARLQLKAAGKEVETSAQGPQALARGGMVYASKGTFVNFKPRGTDTVPAMLTPGEFVVNRQSVQRGNNLAMLKAMNKGQSSPAATGMSKGGQVKYMKTGGLAQDGGDSGVSIGIDVKALQTFAASLVKFNDDLATNIQNLKDIKFQISLSPTNINVNLTGTSFLSQLTNTLKQELISYVGKEISQYTIGSDGKLKKSGSTLGTGL